MDGRRGLAEYGRGKLEAPCREHIVGECVDIALGLESLTGVPEEAASETGPEVAESRELVEAIEEFVDGLRGEEDFLFTTRQREHAPRWHGLRFAGLAC
jgi:hypothetical protein